MTKRWNGLLVYDKEGAKRNASYIKMHEEVGKKLNMPIHFLYDEDVMEYLEINRESVDFCMVRTISPALILLLCQKSAIIKEKPMIIF